MSLTSTLVRVPEEFSLQPALADVLHVVELFGAALVSPPKIETPVAVPAGYTQTWAPAAPPNAVDRRKELTTHLIAWHNQLVTAVQQRNYHSAERVRLDGLVTSTKNDLAASRAQAQSLANELSTALHTIEQLQHDLMTLGQQHADLINSRVTSETGGVS